MTKESKKPQKREVSEQNENSHPLTREGFFKILRKVTKPLPKPPDQEKSKEGND